MKEKGAQDNAQLSLVDTRCWVCDTTYHEGEEETHWWEEVPDVVAVIEVKQNTPAVELARSRRRFLKANNTKSSWHQS